MPEHPNIEAAIHATLLDGRRTDAMAAQWGLARLGYFTSLPSLALEELSDDDEIDPRLAGLAALLDHTEETDPTR